MPFIHVVGQHAAVLYKPHVHVRFGNTISTFFFYRTQLIVPDVLKSLYTPFILRVLLQRADSVTVHILIILYSPLYLISAPLHTNYSLFISCIAKILWNIVNFVNRYVIISALQESK